jgi:light-regulated signal transduction histidine kinase (bacteriophytochrome)
MPVPDMIGYREARIVRLDDAEVLALVRDIGGRKRAELALQALNQELETRVRDRTAELEAANAELEAFSYSVSHDLKAPLRGIDGYSQLLWEDYKERLDDDGRFLLQSVRQGAAQMYRLIDDLLAYSRLERRAVAGGEVELLPILDGLLAERADEIRSRNVRVEISAPEMTARADREGFAQAIRNLLDNALRFTADAPEPRIEIGGEVGPTRCTLWVRDNGIGFDMRYHDRIFEIFQRLHGQEEYPGTGIGLALVRKAMQRMHGRVWAESAPGAGATFYLELPRSSADDDQV